MKPIGCRNVNHSGMNLPIDLDAATVRLVCWCANSAEHEGFYACDIDGHRMATGGFQCCERCGRIIDPVTGKRVGQRTFTLPDDDTR